MVRERLCHVCLLFVFVCLCSSFVVFVCLFRCLFYFVRSRLGLGLGLGLGLLGLGLRVRIVFSIVVCAGCTKMKNGWVGEGEGGF